MNHQKYIGVPYEQANCADLALMIQKEEFGKEYIDYEKPNSENPFSYSLAIKKNLPDYMDPIGIPKDGCAVLLICKGKLSHIGTYLFIKKQHYVLHTSESFKSSILTPMNDLKKFCIDIQGFYQWK